MIRILDLEDEDQIYSISGLIEFEIFYDRLTHLIAFYNYSVGCYYDFLDQKNQERKKIKDNIQEILKSADDQDIYVTEDDIFFTFDEEIMGVKLNYQEYQKMTLIIILFSEVEKLVDNLYEMNKSTGNIRGINIKLEHLCKEKGLDVEETNEILDSFNKLRLIRNKLVHRYDYWDDELVIGGHSYRGVNHLNDEILECFVNSITNSIKKVEECFR